MSKSTQQLTLVARWGRSMPAADRWQALQAQLMEHTPSAALHWSRRSFVTCKWRALPAADSTPALAGSR